MHVNVEYPEIILNIKDVKAAIDAGDKVGSTLEEAIFELDDDIYVNTSKESGIRRREKVLGITPKDTDSIEDRKLEVLLRWYNNQLYTETVLRKKLDAALGKDQYVLNVDIENKTIKCQIELTRKAMFDSISELFEQMVPLDYLLDITLRYNQYKLFNARRYRDLKTRTYSQLRNEVVNIAGDY